MGCTIMLRNNATGETRAIIEKSDWADIEWNWTEGNFGCDCNRALFWHRAANLGDDDAGNDRQCGYDAFTVVSVTLADGTVLGEEGATA